MLPGAAEWLQITRQMCQMTKVNLQEMFIFTQFGMRKLVCHYTKLTMYVSNLLEIAQAAG
jgi:kynureninase